MHPDNTGNAAPFPSGTEADPIASSQILIQIAIAHPYSKLSLNTDEGYLLSVQQQDNKVYIILFSLIRNLLRCPCQLMKKTILLSTSTWSQFQSQQTHTSELDMVLKH